MAKTPPAKPPNILSKIAAYKREEVKALKARTSVAALTKTARAQLAPLGFTQAIRRCAQDGPALIAEVKKASPSKGVIRADFDPVTIAQAYGRGGAACLSVLTDTPSFQGSNAAFEQVRAVSTAPLLRKDFMVEPIQIVESRAMGADAVLVILAMVNDRTAQALMKTAVTLGMDVLVETHDTDELARAIALGATLIGINNRDLRSFHTTLDTFTTLAPKVPAGTTLIAESGIFTPDHILHLTESGAHGFLVGESLMRQADVERATRILRGEIRS